MEDVKENWSGVRSRGGRRKDRRRKKGRNRVTDNQKKEAENEHDRGG